MILEAFLVSLVVVVSAILLYYVFFQVPPGAKMIVKPPPITSSSLEPNQARFMFFYATWCPHCRNAQTPWSSFKELTKNSHYTYGGKDIIFEEINADSDKGKSALYGINAYPTFKLETQDKVYEMVGRPSVDTFKEFLKSALGPEKVIH